MDTNLDYNLTLGSLIVIFYGYLCSRFVVRVFFSPETYNAFSFSKSIGLTLVPWIVFNLVGFGLKSSQTLKLDSQMNVAIAVTCAALVCFFTIKRLFMPKLKIAISFLLLFIATFAVGPLIFLVIAWVLKI